MPGTHQAAVGVEGANGEICSQVAAPADSSGAGHGAEYDGRYHVVDHRERDVALVSRLVFGMVNSLVFDGAAGLSQLAATWVAVWPIERLRRVRQRWSAVEQ